MMQRCRLNAFFLGFELKNALLFERLDLGIRVLAVAVQWWL
jgi:hypothetical protein